MTINKEEFLKYYNMGDTDIDISKKMGCSQARVYRMRTKLELPKNYRGKVSTIDFSKLIEYYNLGLSDKEISDLIGCSRPCVAYHRQKMGLTAVHPSNHRVLREIPTRLSDHAIVSILDDYTPSDEDKPWTDPESLFCDGEFLEKIKSKVVEESR